MKAVRRRRPPALDAREWRDFLIAALNEVGVGIGEEFVIVHGDGYEDDRPDGTLGSSPRRRLDEPREGGARRSDPSTSRKAARDVKPRTGTQRVKILAVIAAKGDHGATSEEAADASGVSFSRSSGPRIAELLRDGYIADTGRTRPGSLGSDQRVLVATEKGREAIEALPSPPPPEPGQVTIDDVIDVDPLPGGLPYPDRDTRGGPRS